MKFGKNLMRVVETSDPEWGPYWINYKFLKRKINEIVEAKGGVKITDQYLARNPGVLSKSACEVEFFRLLRSELKKASDFFASTEQIYRIRKERIWTAFAMLENVDVIQDKNTWTRLLMACVKFYKDVLLIENFAIMNYCGFSKILKKHDKMTGFVTRDAFMRNVMNHQEFTHYPYFMELIREVEQLFANIQKMESVMPLQDEERLFIEAMRDLNHQASRLQAEEKAAIPNLPPAGSAAHPAEDAAQVGGINISEDSRTNDAGSVTAPTAPVEARDPTLDARLTAATLSAFEAGQRLQRSSSHVSLQSLAVQASPSKAKAKASGVGSPGAVMMEDGEDGGEASSESKHPSKRTAEEAGFGFGI